ANEWAGRGVNVNAIAPGYMATDNTAALRADETRSRQILERIPAGRWGTPDDLVGAVIFLASPASSYLNGPGLAVGGGWLGRCPRCFASSPWRLAPWRFWRPPPIRPPPTTASSSSGSWRRPACCCAGSPARSAA